LSRRYLGLWKAEDDGRVFGVPSDGERTGNNAVSCFNIKKESMRVKGRMIILYSRGNGQGA
jgi:hypothetical protein